MSDGHWERVKSLLHRAMQLTPEQRERFLDEACPSDDPCRAEIDSLLLADAEARSSFLPSGGLGPSGAEEVFASAGGLLAGELFEQRFQLQEKLGEGGMGQVWLARQIAPVRRPVALKLIKAGMYDESVVLRFRSERQSLAMMDHPAIAKVFEAGATAQGQPYLVMEYVPGVSISKYCDQQRLGIRARVELFIQACEGVQHAHQKAIMHRDLKPANILVQSVDGKAVPRIIDFGLAKATTAKRAGEDEFTRLGQFLGTPGYISPEQAEGQDIDTRTDVYSLGVVLYVLLAGYQPFDRAPGERPPLDVLLRQLREEDPPPPSAKLGLDREAGEALAQARGTSPAGLAQQLRGDLDSITLKALERDRTRRYGTPSELAADLKRHLNDEPVTARPASTAYQIRKFIRRHRIAALAAGAIAVLALVASSAGLIAVRKQHEAEVQRREAQFQARQALEAQSRLLTDAAAQRLKDSDVAGAQGIILEVLMNPEFPHDFASPAISAFQEIRAADALLAVLSGHDDRVYGAAYSPDGTRIVTASADKTARIWDARSGVQLAVLRGHTERVSCSAYSPDGSRIVTASWDKTARIWDARTGTQLAVLVGHGDRLYDAAYSPDGTRIITASWDKTARIWDAHSGAPLAVLTGHDDALYTAAYSPDGKRILTASQDKTARIWDARTAVPLMVLKGHGDYVASAAFSPDGTRIVTTSADRTARIWDARTGVQLTVLSGHGDVVYGARYSPTGLRIVTASWDKTARIWDARTGEQLALLGGHGATVASAAFSPDGTRIVTASQDKTARIWDALAGGQLAVLAGHGAAVHSAAYSPDGSRLVTASQDQSARIWDARTAAQLAVLYGHAGAIDTAAYSSDGLKIVTASQDKSARIWDARTATALAVLLGHGDRVYSAAYSPDGTRIVTASRDKTARIWDARSGAQLTVLSGHGDRVYSAAYSPDGTRIVTASRDRTAVIWDARTGARLVLLTGHGDQVATAVFSPDGARILTSSPDRTARIWNARTGAPLAVLSGHRAALASASYSPDGTRIVTASLDKTARIWDAHSGAQLAVFAGHGDILLFAAYSPDGNRVVTSSEDRTARIWDARVTGDLQAQIWWAAAAQPDPLSEDDRAQLGLPADAPARTRPASGPACDEAASALYDPDRVTRGGLAVALDIADAACAEEIAKREHAPRADYLMGRTLIAKGDVDGARRRLQIAVARGYRAARIDLADLLRSAPQNGDSNALSLYRQAWADGVPIAAFRLGRIYELRSTPASAWQWYQRGAEAGEPNALARLAERDETDALAETDRRPGQPLLLQSFARYALAAERARLEGWPHDAWRLWRHRRASLARVLAREGLMREVAAEFRGVLDHARRTAAPGPTHALD